MREPESPAVRQRLDDHAMAENLLVTSALTAVEVSRSVRSRLDSAPPAQVVELVETALSGVLQMPLTDQVLSLARRLGPSTLRSLDAIHLAAATLLGVDEILTYDQRMLVAAAELGFATSSPV